MENILNKALSEALTPQYSEELRDAFDTGYKFSPEFENKMRELIRRTDRPVTRYIGYMAAAAVAVIAIGSAIIVPTIMNSGVEVKQPENTTASDTAIVTEPSVTASLTSTEASSSVDDEDDNIVTDPAPSVSDTSPTETSVPDGSGTDTSDTTVSTSDTTLPAVTDDEVVDDEKEADVEPSDDEEITNDDAVEAELDEEDDVAADEPTIVTPDGDDDITIGVGDYAIDETFTVEVNDGDILGEVMKKIFPDFDFNNVWATSGNYTPAGTKFRAENLNFYRCEYPFIQDFVHSLGSAVRDTDLTQFDHNSVDQLHLWIGTKQVTVSDYSEYGQNISAWKNYDAYFNMNEDEYPAEEEDPVYDDIVAYTEPFMQITVFSSGRIDISGNYVISDKIEKKNYLYKLGNSSFYMDTEAVNELFAALRSTHLSEKFETVGDIVDSMRIDGGNIAQTYVDVHDLYDTDLYNMPIDDYYIVRFLDHHRGDKLTKVRSSTLSEQINPTGEICIEFYTRDCAHLKLYLSADGKCYIADDFVAYRFDISQADIESALDAVGKANNFTIPRYSTLDEYLSDKHFDKLEYVTFKGRKDGKTGLFTVDNETELNNIYELLKKEFAGAEYIKGNSTYDAGRSVDINIEVKGYFYFVQFRENDVVTVRALNNNNRFKMSEGAVGRLKALLAECANARFSPDEYDDDWEQAADDIDIEENTVIEEPPVDEPEVVDDPDADKNPVT